MEISDLKPPVLFISDAHLGGFSEQENQRIESDLIQLINYCQRNQIQLAILGDLFDYWMEYPDYVPKLGQKLLERFKDYNRKMGPTLYITGNHDNWTRQHFTDLGFLLKHEQVELTINETTLMVLHGDGLKNPDLQLQRPRMHRLLRAPKFIDIYQKVFPPKMGITLMKYFSKLTRTLEWNPNKKDRLNKWAGHQLKATDLDVLICGHDHMPRRKQFTFGTYINLGTFYRHKTMALYNNDAISLVCWESDTQSLKNFDAKDL